MSTPAKTRVDSRTDAVTCPAIARLRATLTSDKKVVNAFVKWRRNSFTRMFLAALSELADSPPLSVNEPTDTNSVLLQHGMTDGLNLAFRLLSQPQRVYPDIFADKDGKTAGGVDEFDVAYVDTPDSVIDDMTKQEGSDE